MSKNVVEIEGPQITSQYGAYALHAGLAILHALHVCACTRPRARIPSCTHSHACTHRPISDTYRFTTATMIRERTSILRYTYISPLVYNRNGVCLLRGTNRTFKYFRLLLFTKGRNISAIVSLLIRT